MSKKSGTQSDIQPDAQKRNSDIDPANGEIETRRYNMVISLKTFELLEQLAARDELAVIDVLKRFIRLGLMVDRLQTEGGSIILKEKDREDREIFFM